MITPPLSEISRLDYVHTKTCIGITLKGARCGNAVAARNANLALSKLQSSAYQKYPPQLLMQCAGLLLCQRHHQGQAGGIVEDWLAEKPRRRSRKVRTQLTDEEDARVERIMTNLERYSYEAQLQESDRFVTTDITLRPLSQQGSPSFAPRTVSNRVSTSVVVNAMELKPFSIQPVVKSESSRGIEDPSTRSPAAKILDAPRTPNRSRQELLDDSPLSPAQPEIFTKSTEKSLKSCITATSADEDDTTNFKPEDSPCPSKGKGKECEALFSVVTPPRLLANSLAQDRMSELAKEEKVNHLEFVEEEKEDDSTSVKEEEENGSELKVEAEEPESKHDDITLEATPESGPGNQQGNRGTKNAVNTSPLSQPQRPRPVYIKSRSRIVRRSVRLAHTRQASASASASSSSKSPPILPKLPAFDPEFTAPLLKPSTPSVFSTQTQQVPITDLFSAIQDIQAVCFSMMQKSIDEIAQAAVARQLDERCSGSCCAHFSSFSVLSHPFSHPPPASPWFSPMTTPRLPTINRDAHTFTRDVLVAVSAF